MEFTKISSTTFQILNAHLLHARPLGWGMEWQRNQRVWASQNTGLVTSLLMSGFGSTDVSRILIGCGPCSRELSHLTPVLYTSGLTFCTRELFFRIFTDSVEGGSGSNANNEAGTL